MSLRNSEPFYKKRRGAADSDEEGPANLKSLPEQINEIQAEARSLERQKQRVQALSREAQLADLEKENQAVEEGDTDRVRRFQAKRQEILEIYDKALAEINTKLGVATLKSKEMQAQKDKITKDARRSRERMRSFPGRRPLAKETDQNTWLDNRRHWL